MEEFLAFLHKYFPNFEKEHLKFPGAFSYDPNTTGGGYEMIDQTDDRPVGNARAKDWRKAMEGRRGERLLEDALHRPFKKRPSLIWNSFERGKLFNIAKDTIKHKLNKAKAEDDFLLEVPLLTGERDLLQLVSVDIKKLEKELEDFVKEIFLEKQELTANDLDEALEKNCKHWAKRTQVLTKGLLFNY